MSAAIGLAGIFGPLLVILGIWSLLFAQHQKKVMDDLKKSPSLFHFSAIINLLIGIIVVSITSWHGNETFLVPLFGWVQVVRSLIGIFLPKFYLSSFDWGRGAYIFISFVIILWGLGMCRVAFSWL